MPTIQCKRVYDGVDTDDGVRILVDRLWPRGISKENAQLAGWPKSIAPSNELRKWYGHDPAKWDEFRERYFAELDANPDGVAELQALVDDAGKKGTVTFLFSCKELEQNNATALVEYLTH